MLALVAYACGGEAATDPITDPPDPPVVATLEITPTADTLVALGGTATFAAIAKDAAGNQLSGVSITWSSSEPAVATVVQSTGIATAVSNGVTQIAATSGSISAISSLTVRQELATLELTPTAATRVPVEPVQFTATPADANGHAIDDLIVTWSLSDSTVAAVDSTGEVIGDTLGLTIVSATADTFVISAPVKIVRAFSDVSVSEAHACGLGVDGAANCWGQSGAQLGLGTDDTEQLTPAAVLGDLEWRVVSTAGPNTCGVTPTDQLYCWGYNNNGELGADQTPETCFGFQCSTQPLRIADSLSFLTVNGGLGHTCAVDVNGAAYCWGVTIAPGDGTEWQGPTPGPVAVVGGLSFRQLATGIAHTCSLTDSDDAYCWGDNGNYQLGDGTTEPLRFEPVPVAGGIKFQSIATSHDHTCGISLDGSAYCWGRNVEGQFGVPGSAEFSTTPVLISSEMQFIDIAPGMLHTCAVTTAGQGFCWGENDFGQLGDGTTAPASTPREIAGDFVFASISTRAWDTCGVTDYGAVVCWGANHEGIVGDGTKTQRLSPVRVYGLPQL